MVIWHFLCENFNKHNIIHFEFPRIVFLFTFLKINFIFFSELIFLLFFFISFHFNSWSLFTQVKYNVRIIRNDQSKVFISTFLFFELHPSKMLFCLLFLLVASAQSASMRRSRSANSTHYVSFSRSSEDESPKVCLFLSSVSIVGHEYFVSRRRSLILIAYIYTGQAEICSSWMGLAQSSLY